MSDLCYDSDIENINTWKVTSIETNARLGAAKIYPMRSDIELHL